MTYVKMTSPGGFSGTKHGKKTKWGAGITRTVERTMFPILCTDRVLHAYTSVNHALLCNYNKFKKFILFEATGRVVTRRDSSGSFAKEKAGFHKLTTLKQIPIPKWWLDAPKRKDVLMYLAKKTLFIA